MTTESEHYDVIQIGFGPVGQTQAALLGAQGHRVAVFERWPALYPMARAGHVDHEIMRVFQNIGAAAAIERASIPIPDYEWINGEGKLILHLDWNHATPSGWKSDYLIYQSYVEDALISSVRRETSVEVNTGWEATAITDCGDHVEVTVRQGTLDGEQWVPTGKTRTVTARYLIGADGANSLVRRTFDMPMTDLGFQEDWLVLDIRPDHADLNIDMPEAAQICDPARPRSLFRWLGREHARMEFMLLPGEHPAEMKTAENAWRMLSDYGLNADNCQVVRRAVYTFRSLLADNFRQGRVLLVGDAAHQMPPFMGQGMCSGVRDAVNLAWKLDLVLSGTAPETLLDTYTTERRPHADELIKTSIQLGKIVCVADPQAAAARDAMFLKGEAPPLPPFPWLQYGVVSQAQEGDTLTGHLGLQARVAVQGQTGLLDDLTGHGWRILSRDRATRDVVRRHDALLGALKARHLLIHRANVDLDSVIDVDGDYNRWFGAAEADTVIVRPDFYVYGVARTPDELSELLDQLTHDLGLTARDTVSA